MVNTRQIKTWLTVMALAAATAGMVSTAQAEDRGSSKHRSLQPTARAGIFGGLFSNHGSSHNSHRHSPYHRSGHSDKSRGGIHIDFNSHGSSHHRHHEPRHYKRYVPGHYITTTERVLVQPAHHHKVWHAAEYKWICDSHGHRRQVLVSPGHYDTQYVPARYETRVVKKWVPGCYETVHNHGDRHYTQGHKPGVRVHADIRF